MGYKSTRIVELSILLLVRLKKRITGVSSPRLKSSGVYSHLSGNRSTL